LRHHPSIIELKKKFKAEHSGKVHDIELSYITSRGKWYHYSWKGDVKKSGGVVTNIGIHFFDMLSWIFGEMKESHVHLLNENKASGLLQLEKANVKWFLSIDRDELPQKAIGNKQTTFRSIKIDDREIEFSGGFTDLHTVSYQQIIDGKGYGISEARNSIEIAHKIRNQIPGAAGERHSFLK
jgi:UDP-N-acetyl-2-amino-2-deoxyglucuronate dehydrogenase